NVQEEIISRVKVMGRMNIAEKRLAQDGRATVQIGDRVVDLRIASLPTSFGERVVIRLLDKSARLYELPDLGMDSITLARFGHLVFSTLHTNDAASAVTRLLDLGIEPYLVASSVVAVLAQRLVRRVCPDCAKSHTPDASELRWLGVDASRATLVRTGAGCPVC